MSRLFVRRSAIAGAVVLVVLYALGQERPRLGSGVSSVGVRPNVVLIVADTLRQDNLTTYGYERPTTPRIDAFAEQSVVFEQAVSVGASTPPTLSAIMTGRLPFYEPSILWSPLTSHGMRRFFRDGEQKGLPLSLETLAERFQKEGYETFGIVNNAFLKRTYRFDQGFDEFIELFNRGRVKYGSAEQITTRAIEFLRAEHDRPFFLYVHYMDPHQPHAPPAPYTEAFGAKRKPGADVRDFYDASVAYMDQWVGELLDEIGADGFGDTIIAFLSDHGEEFFDHGVLGHTGQLYEELVRVPMILRVPGVRPRREGALVRNFDIGPTLLSLAGVGPLDGEIDAVDLAGLVREKPRGVRPPVIASFPVIPRNVLQPYRPARRMIRDERYKLIFDLANPEKSTLFDLEADAAERTNVFDEHPDVVARLLAEVEQVLEKLESENARGVERLAAMRAEGDGLSALVAGRGSLVRKNARGITVRSRKRAPEFDLPYVAPGPDGRLFARLEFAEPVQARVVYRRKEDGALRHEVQGIASPDGRTIQFEVSDPGLVGPLTVRIGEEPGAVVVTSVTVARTRDGLVGSDMVDAPTESLDTETIDQLRALGYVE